MHIDVALQTLYQLLTTPQLLSLMLIAVPLGVFFGSTPGMGGKLGLVLMIPFVYGMAPLPGAVFLCAMHAVVHTGGAIPSILVGVPGDGPTAATVLDGYAMTKKGMVGRALGASFAASTVGGLFGACFLGAMLPIIGMIILNFGPAEFFLLAVLGITFIAVLSGNSLVKGLIVGLGGLMASFIGLDPSTGSPRFTFGQLFLWDGLSVIVAVLAMYAIPEMLTLGVKGREKPVIPEGGKLDTRVRYSQVFEGIKDVWIHRFLVVRCAILISLIGVVPGLGGDAAAWMAYGHAVQSSKHPEKFGTGVVEGVIAPETGSCAKEAGSLLPTLFFGVPGSSGMAIMLGAFLMLGIQPGQSMLVEHLDITWSLIWALAFANVICAVLLIAGAPWLALLGKVKPTFLVPYVLVFAMLGCYLFRGEWQNMLLVLVMGTIGYMLKRHDWPRPPFVIGVILGSVAEDSLQKSVALGASLFERPVAAILLALIASSIGFYIYRARKPKGALGPAAAAAAAAAAARAEGAHRA